MPVFFEQNIEFAKIAVWEIVEEKNFFLNKVALQREITHSNKQLQHLAGRYLLQHLHEDFPYDLMEIADDRKPFLLNDKYHFSISHCNKYAAVIISEHHRVGIDIELVTPKIEKVKHKFLNDDELDIIQYSKLNTQYSTKIDQLITYNLQLLTLFWCCKEAVFKWYNGAGVDFRTNICLKPFDIDPVEGVIKCEFIKEKKISLNIEYRFFDGLYLAWVQL